MGAVVLSPASQKRSGVREVVGVASVVISLLFVGWEIRQNTKVARGQTRLELTALNNEFLERIRSDSEFSEIWRTAWNTEETLDEAAEYRIEFMMMQYLRLLENVHLQYQEGLLDPDALASYGFLGFYDQFMAHPRFPSIWEGRRVAFDPEFVSFLESGDYEHLR